MSKAKPVTDEPSQALENNPKYKQYVAAVDKALKAFEYTNEWADLISALGKLTKVRFVCSSLFW
jgi:hypothetical protein